MKKNFSPKNWGPYGWYFFHIISFTYSIDDSIDDIKINNNIKEINKKNKRISKFFRRLKHFKTIKLWKIRYEMALWKSKCYKKYQKL